MFITKKLVVLCLLLLGSMALHAAESSVPANGVASSFTKKAQQDSIKDLDFASKEDYELASRGFIAASKNNIIPTAGVPYDLHAMYFTLNKPAPDTVNPSLWRHAQLITKNGLYKVADKIYQIRGYDASNMTLIEGKKGWLIIDPLASNEVAAAGLKLANEQLGARPVSAVIFTHSHIDHFGGVAGVLTEKEIADKKIPIIAPENFSEEAISENLYAGNVMTRRTLYMYGAYLPNNPKGSLTSGLGPLGSFGTRSFAEPTKIISKTGEKMTVDGVDIVFQMAQHTEAPAEMLFYFPQLKALCMSEDAVATLHNVYTLRGAKARDPLVWSKVLNTSLEMFGNDVQVAFASHLWPRWENAKIKEYLTNQRDVYRFINDQTLRLANMGYDPDEIAARIKMPHSLAKNFYNRGYYGSLSHNVRATFTNYLGFYNGNPATLNEHPRDEQAKRYLTAFGGASKFIQVGKKALADGDYRWAAEVLNRVVYAQPDNKSAKDLLAKAYEQMGFQTENGTWRGFYLMGAKELRQNRKNPNPPFMHPESLPLAMLFDYAAIRINAERAENKKIGIALKSVDTGENYSLVLNNSVLYVNPLKENERFDTTVQMKAIDIKKVFGGVVSLDEAMKNGNVKVAGQESALKSLIAVMDDITPNFNLVTPVGYKGSDAVATPISKVETNENQARR
ncbi:alkyl/aryl-sulfatase [Bdellovibrio sp. HCB274]|uniref:alkyl/aryl-sulfatase n=1 Tax=Bdellovibrio sp. HCB274 TaxID=3394361 RepID=UPI0039B49DED